MSNPTSPWKRDKAEINGYLIDPERRKITLAPYDGNFKSIYSLIEAQLFDLARFAPNGDGAFVDDEGLLKNPRNFFIINGYCQPLAGKGFVLGVDDEGNSIAPRTPLDAVVANVGFFELLFTEPARGCFCWAKRPKRYQMILMDQIKIQQSFVNGTNLEKMPCPSSK